MPIIASECPGWVCYAEKRVGDLALPFMSKTKSPQQILGTLVKLYLAKKQGDVSDISQYSPNFVIAIGV